MKYNAKWYNYNLYCKMVMSLCLVGLQYIHQYTLKSVLFTRLNQNKSHYLSIDYISLKLKFCQSRNHSHKKPNNNNYFFVKH